jgi:hypothetical protein
MAFGAAGSRRFGGTEHDPVLGEQLGLRTRPLPTRQFELPGGSAPQETPTPEPNEGGIPPIAPPGLDSPSPLDVDVPEAPPSLAALGGGGGGESAAGDIASVAAPGRLGLGQRMPPSLAALLRVRTY